MITGIGVHDPPDSAFTINWTERSQSNGFSVHDPPERASADIKSAGLDWISALRGPAIKDLLNSGAIQLTLFDTRDMASITSPDYPDLM